MKSRFCLPFVALLFVFLTGESNPARGEIRLPGFYGNHMVLQRDLPIRLWGWGNPGEKVTIRFGDDLADCVTSEQGRWEAMLPSHSASKSGKDLIFSGDNQIELKDVLVGEVWLCSGQSNMEWTVAASTNAAEEIAAANYPTIRHMKVAHRPSTVSVDDLDSQWQVCTPEVVGGFTACGYFMAVNLQAELDVPIGLINSSWGGTRVEPWTPPLGFEKVESLESIYQSVMEKTPGSVEYQAALESQIAETEKWLEQARLAWKTKGVVEPSPSFPDSMKPFQSHQDPTMLYHGMIHALVGFPIRGAIWYQGESNHTEGMLYYEKKKALIEGWRELWGQGDFPFYYVQIAPFQYGAEDPTILAEFWESQAAVQQIPNTAMVVINDIATLNDIHPPNKQDVGKRLALLALKNNYGMKQLVASSPEMESMVVLEDHLRIKFRNTGGGLRTRDGKEASYFEVIGPGSRGFKSAKAEILDDTIILRSDMVDNPVAFRFAWDKLAEPNLMGGTGLPVGAFRGGVEPDFLSLLSIQDEYELVYELDLSRLGQRISYQYDGSDSIGKFDRIAYLLELKSEERGEQKIFVSMDAFTEDAKKIGVPTALSGASFRQSVGQMDVFSNVGSIALVERTEGGTIEFWPDNYATENSAEVPGASGRRYDFGDEPALPVDGYGSMQVHLPSAKQTLFAINHWRAGADADLGIGNATGDHTDWTFSGSAKTYTEKRLRVYVRPIEKR